MRGSFQPLSGLWQLYFYQKFVVYIAQSSFLQWWTYLSYYQNENENIKHQSVNQSFNHWCSKMWKIWLMNAKFCEVEEKEQFRPDYHKHQSVGFHFLIWGCPHVVVLLVVHIQSGWSFYLQTSLGYLYGLQVTYPMMLQCHALAQDIGCTERCINALGCMFQKTQKTDCK